MIDQMADIEWLPRHLLPASLAPRRRRSWDLPRARTLPKASDPACSHRPLVNRRPGPTAELDSVLCKAGIAALRILDVSEHLDIDRPVAVVEQFGTLSETTLGPGKVRIIDKDSDMKGCFTHVPQKETIGAVEYVCKEVRNMGFSVFMVYKGRNSSMPSYPGSYARRGYVEVDINVLPRYTSHHCGHCYARFVKVIQSQIEGHPMGSAFSVFLQRCWAVFRELFFSRNLDLHTLRIPRRRISFVRLGAVWAALLELRYADDISQSVLLPEDSPISDAAVMQFLQARLDRRYAQLGGNGITLVQGTHGRFIGLLKSYDPVCGIRVRPSISVTFDPQDPSDYALDVLIPHRQGWHPPGLPYALLCGFVARASSLASAPHLAHISLVEFLIVFLRSGYSAKDLLLLSRRWDSLHLRRGGFAAQAVQEAIWRHEAQL